MLSELSLSALTDVMLASFQAFAAGLLFRPDLQKGSAARLWAWTMTLISAVFLIGAIDHGFFETVNHPLHHSLLIANRALVAVASFMIAMTTAMQFLGAFGRKVVLGVAGLGNAVVVVLVFLSDNFFIVIGSYSAAMLFMLVLNLNGLRYGKGSFAMIAGIVVTFGASALPLVGYQGFGDLGVYATYHIALMPAVVAFYLGGLALDRAPSASDHRSA
jgi:hypothetical protein